MVAALVVMTFVAFILLDYYLVQSRKKAVQTATASSSGNLYFHPGQTWARVAPNGLVTVGVTEFASSFAGSLSRVKLPARGGRLEQGEPAWTLVSDRNRRLTQVMPVEGKVIAVNKKLREDPALLQESPYENGWLLCVRPRRLQDTLSNLLHGKSADAWKTSSREALVSRLAPALGTVAHDGGEWAAGFGDRLDDDDWEAVKADLFPDAEPPRG